MKTSKNPIVAGIDVGGARKGFHGVALAGGVYQAQLHTMDAVAMARWLREIGAQAIGVDAPCRWSLDGRPRPAERELMGQGIQCFASPTREAAVRHPQQLLRLDAERRGFVPGN
jgi:predicted nuclease with RNAse H fold